MSSLGGVVMTPRYPARAEGQAKHKKTQLIGVDHRV